MLISRSERYPQARMRQALWIMYHGLPSTVVSSPLYKKFICSLNNTFAVQERTSESREEQTLYGYFFKGLKERLKKCAEFFNHKPFISFQMDCWTSQSNMSVCGISISYFDIV